MNAKPYSESCMIIYSDNVDCPDTVRDLIAYATTITNVGSGRIEAHAEINGGKRAIRRPDP